MKEMIIFSVLIMATTSLKTPSEKGKGYFTHSVTTEAKPESIWHLWTDVRTWKQWDTGLKDAYLDEEYRPGARGHIIALDGRKASFEVTEYQEGKSTTFRTRLPLGALHVRRSLQQAGGRTVFTHEVWFTGLLGGVFSRKLGPDFKEKLPEAMAKLDALALEATTANP